MGCCCADGSVVPWYAALLSGIFKLDIRRSSFFGGVLRLKSVSIMSVGQENTAGAKNGARDILSLGPSRTVPAAGKRPDWADVRCPSRASQTWLIPFWGRHPGTEKIVHVGTSVRTAKMGK